MTRAQAFARCCAKRRSPQVWEPRRRGHIVRNVLVVSSGKLRFVDVISAKAGAK